MGTKLNEVSVHYSHEGWDHFYLAMAGTDCEILVDMFTEMFGPPEMFDPTDLKTPTAKKAHTEAEQYEEETLCCEGGPDTSKPKVLYPTSTTLPVSIRIPPEYCPVVTPAEEISKASGKLVMKTYYQCVICSHHSQNKDSTSNHTHCYLNITLTCSWPKCDKSYEASDSFKEHVNKKHGGQVAPAALSKEEGKAVVAGLLSAK